MTGASEKNERTPTAKDKLAGKYLGLEQRRKAGAFIYDAKNPAEGPDGISAAERNNWNVAAADMAGIGAVLADDEPFTDKALETDESDLDQIHDAVNPLRVKDPAAPMPAASAPGRNAQAEKPLSPEDRNRY